MSIQLRLPNTFTSLDPFPHIVIDDALNTDFAQNIQEEIVNIPITEFDRYSNPFEQKWTLRNKNAMPKQCSELFDYFNSDQFIERLSKTVGIPLIRDSTKNFWGIHIFGNGDKLDIHVDAGIHPTTKLKKEITLGLYLSYNWKTEYGGELELWSGTSARDNNAKLSHCAIKVEPKFNRLVIFQCNDYSWHGSTNVVKCPENSKRIFLTISYLSDRHIDDKFENVRQKAFFIATPNEPENPEKDKLRLLRADPDKYKDVYRIVM
jgi:Rps23 Pro-64 3,4-dihydroxylase Tpa1-like proline 4-hydroxylase